MVSLPAIKMHIEIILINIEKFITDFITTIFNCLLMVLQLFLIFNL